MILLASKRRQTDKTKEPNGHERTTATPPPPPKISQKIQGKEKECEKKQNKLVIHVSFGEIAISLIFSIMMLSASNVKFSAFKIGFVQRTWEATEVLRILEISVVSKHVVKERYYRCLL